MVKFVFRCQGVDDRNIIGLSSELDTPTKTSFPQLRKAENQTWLFNSIPGPRSNQNAYRGPSAFTTPRKLLLEADDTSGPEQSSPIYADSEATPDLPSRASPSKATSLIRFEGSKSENKPSTSNLFNRSGKGDIPKRATYTDIVNRKVEKRRRRITDRDVHNAPRRYSNDSDSEERPSSGENAIRKAKRQGDKAFPRMGFVPSVLTFIDAHPSLPSTLSYYVQFLLNCVFAFCLMYILYGIFSTIRNDIDERAIMESSEILAEMAVCAREFKDNKCERDTRVPAMESVCNGWEKCMARDPYKVGRSRLSAGMFAEIFNSFIEPISVKAIVSFMLLLFVARNALKKSPSLTLIFQMVSVSVIIGCFTVNNLTFGIYRARHQPPAPAPSQPAYMQHAHPQQYPHQQHLGYTSQGFPQFQNPYQNQLGGISSSGGFTLENERSPSKRLEYR